MSEKIDFEKSVKRLEEITEALEKGNLSLDEMIELYTEGTKLVSVCQKALSEAQVKITKLEMNEK